MTQCLHFYYFSWLCLHFTLFRIKKILNVYFIVLKIYFMYLGISPAWKCECHRSAVFTESRKGLQSSWNWSYSRLRSALWVLRTGCGTSVKAVGLLTIGSLLQSPEMSLSLILGPFVVQWTLTGKPWMRGVSHSCPQWNFLTHDSMPYTGGSINNRNKQIKITHQSTTKWKYWSDYWIYLNVVCYCGQREKEMCIKM